MCLYVWTQPKYRSPGGTKRVDLPSGKDLKYAFHSLTSDPQRRRDSKVRMYTLRLQLSIVNFVGFIIYKIKCFIV